MSGREIVFPGPSVGQMGRSRYLVPASVPATTGNEFVRCSEEGWWSSASVDSRESLQWVEGCRSLGFTHLPNSILPTFHSSTPVYQTNGISPRYFLASSRKSSLLWYVRRSAASILSEAVWNAVIEIPLELPGLNVLTTGQKWQFSKEDSCQAFLSLKSVLFIFSSKMHYATFYKWRIASLIPEYCIKC